jgi:ribosomal protein L44E
MPSRFTLTPMDLQETRSQDPEMCVLGDLEGDLKGDKGASRILVRLRCTSCIRSHEVAAIFACPPV